VPGRTDRCHRAPADRQGAGGAQGRRPSVRAWDSAAGRQCDL
jgi:hypothetical protein